MFKCVGDIRQAIDGLPDDFPLGVDWKYGPPGKSDPGVIIHGFERGTTWVADGDKDKQVPALNLMVGIQYLDEDHEVGNEDETLPTHQVVDFGPGPEDNIQGYPFEGDEAECAQWIEQHQVTCSGRFRYALQEIPEG